MSDPEHLACDLAQTLSERHVEGFEDHLPERIGIVTRRHDDAGEHVRIFTRFGAQDFETPRTHRATRCLAVPRVTREHVVESLLHQHRNRFVQSVQQVRRRCVREVPIAIRRQHFVPGPVGFRQLRALRGGQRLFRNGVEAQSGRQHQSFLRACDGDVDAPLVMPIIDRADPGYGVDHEQCRMPCAIDRRTDFADAAGDAGRRLVMNTEHRLDLVRPIFGQARLDFGRIDAAAPIPGNEIDDQPELHRDALPQRRELAGLEHQDAVAGRQCVDERGFPCPGPRRRIDDHVRPGLEDVLQPGEHRLAEIGKLGTAMVDRRMIDRAQDPIGDVRWSRDLKKMAPAGGIAEAEHRGSP